MVQLSRRFLVHAIAKVDSIPVVKIANIRMPKAIPLGHYRDSVHWLVKLVCDDCMACFMDRDIQRLIDI